MPYFEVSFEIFKKKILKLSGRYHNYVLHKITIVLKFMSYMNSDLPVPLKKLQTLGEPQCTKWINGLEAGR